MIQSISRYCFADLTFSEQLTIGIIGGTAVAVVGFVIWMLQRWLTKAPESEAAQRVKTKVEARAALKEQGLPYAALDRSIHEDVRRLGKTEAAAAFDPEEAKRISEAMRELTESAKQEQGTATVSTEQLERIGELIEVLFNQVVDSTFSAIGLLDWLGRLDAGDARIPMLILERDVSLLKTLKAMREMGIEVRETEQREITRYAGAIDLSEMDRAIDDLGKLCGVPQSLLQSFHDGLSYVRGERREERDAGGPKEEGPQ